MGKGRRACTARILPSGIDAPERTKLHEMMKSRCRWMREGMRRGREHTLVFLPHVVHKKTGPVDSGSEL